MNRVPIISCVALAGLLATASASFAFPTWIGVYGSFERHDGDNPGRFTILMNQNYYGLHAEVGIQINGGAWNVYPMTWTGVVDGNSKWQYVPTTSFPAGAAVEYYFHGFDDWGGHIYDSVGGANYDFTVPTEGGGDVGWGGFQQLPGTSSGSAYDVDIAACNGTLYAVWVEGQYPTLPSLRFSKKANGSEWETPIEIATGSLFYPRIAVASWGINVLYNSETDQSAKVIRSTDGGASWGAPVAFTGDFTQPPARYAQLAVDGEYLYVVYDDFMAPETSRVNFRKMHKDAAAWEAPVRIFDRTSYKSTVYIDNLEVQGSKIVVTSYSQSWYGGFSTPFFHESSNGGMAWTEKADKTGTAQEIDLLADGTVYSAYWGGSHLGAGTYFQKGSVGGTWNDVNVIWTHNGSVDFIRQTSRGLVTASSISGLRYVRESADDGATWSNPVLIGSDNSWCSKDVQDGDDIHLLVNKDGVYGTVSGTQAAGVPLQWVGNTYHWPLNGDIQPDDFLWVNVESYPRGAGVSGQVVYSTDNVNWFALPLTLAGDTGANDWWHLNLGKFPAGTDVKYAVMIEDGLGNQVWDNNNGQDFLAEVDSQGAGFAPVFWGLDPYRNDTEKVRVNGLAANASHSFGVFQDGQNLTVVARPVENGNGNLVQQYGVSFGSWLEYSTDPTFQTGVTRVQGVFHPAGMSNKPIFDYCSYELGVLPASTTVYFWLGATNGAGSGYAQTAGNDFSLSTAVGDGDSDNDGLPDQWELDYFLDLDEDAEGNPDLDGYPAQGLPYANIIEWATGRNPTVPNDPTGVSLMWSPAYPEPGQPVTLSYFWVNEGSPLFGKPVYAHVGHNGWQAVFDTPQLQVNGGVFRFETTITVPAGATELNLAFHDNAGTWDNNGGQNWRIPVKPAGGGGAPQVAAAQEASSVASPKFAKARQRMEMLRTRAKALRVAQRHGAKLGSLVPAAASTATIEKPAQAGSTAAEAASSTGVQIEIEVLGETGLNPLFAVVGHDDWKDVQGVPLRKVEEGVYAGVCSLAAGSTVANVALTDGATTLDLNDGAGWNFTLVGDDLLTIQK